MALKNLSTPKAEKPQAGTPDAVTDLSFEDQYSVDRKAELKRELLEALRVGALGDSANTARREGKREVVLPDGTTVRFN
jgi:hypothetical protein